jgi:hypothetical protein
VRIIRGDIFKEDFSKATVVTMYLLPELNLCVRHRLLAMNPGTRATSNQFTMGDWEADETAEVEFRTALLWIVPARVGGSWSFRDADGNVQFDVTLQQNYQRIGGEMTLGGKRQPLLGAALQGDAIRFTYVEASGAPRHFSGTVRGKTIFGGLRAAGTTELAVTGTVRALAPAPWAEMANGCDRYYAN